MAANAQRLIALAMVPELAKEVAAQIDDNLPVEPGSIEDADIAADAAIATSKLADGTEIAALVAVETELSALAASDLVTAVAAPAVYSEVAADIAAALVAAGLMQAE
ncbi:hypothetical protein [Rhizorhapis suberifaciens]|uniref:Uncharacterized protein n=1 Tax=Rhizorhapis suberifaciens TaxID=13656 RepID=A0A840HWM7_9SPHN|nr:hypothetical protein [Rhizorhapis suberifaciens]MBB4642363.1 hypothetical protein [Rhizorhapis suberifaciens]